MLSTTTTDAPNDAAGADAALLRSAAAYREDATRFLHDLGLVEQWQEYGAVELTGSYRWDLMLGREIDLNVIIPTIDLDGALSIFNRFARQGRFLRFAFIDTLRGKPRWADPATYPDGYFLGMAGDFPGHEWKVETWLLRSAPPSQEWVSERMTPDRRGAILRLKQQRNDGQWRACSYDIYRAVLLGRAATSAEATDWLKGSQASPG